MHLVIISGAARPQSRSNTAKIIAAFREGFETGGNTSETWYLSDRRQWDKARIAFAENNNILFALPLYVENIPGIMLEFLEGLAPKKQSGTRISFLLQGGFPEASQGRCCEEFLQTLPEQFGCEYGGTLIKGGMFGIGLIGKRLGAKMVRPFMEMGKLFSEHGCFKPEIAADFAGAEYLTPKQAEPFGKIGVCLNKWLLGRIARGLGCRDKLDAKPYEN